MTRTQSSSPNALLRLVSFLSLGLCLPGCFFWESDDDDDDPPPPEVEELDYEFSSSRYMVDEVITRNSIDDFLGVITTLSTFVSTPPLPAGLMMLPGTGDIIGVPQVAAPRTLHRVEISNTGRLVGIAETTIEVFARVPPAGLRYSENPATYTALLFIADNVPAYAGLVTSFSVSPPLPNGLRLDATTGNIRGVPQDEQPASTYTISASNAVGSTSVDLSITVLPSRFAKMLLVTDNQEPVLLTHWVDGTPGSPYPLGHETLTTGAVDVASDPLGRRVFVLGLNGEIRSYATHPERVRLMDETLQATVVGASRLEVDSTGTHLLVLGSGSLTAFDIGAAGELIAPQSASAPVGSMDLLLHPSADFAYVSNGFSGGVSVYVFDDGLVPLPGTAPLAGFADDLAAPNDGTRLYVTDSNNASIHTFAIDVAAGSAAAHLTPSGPPVSIPGGEVQDLVASPDGALVMASTGFNGTVEVFPFDTALGSLTTPTSNAVGSYITELRMDEASRHLFALDIVAREISDFRPSGSSLFLNDRGRTWQAPGTLEVLRGPGYYNPADHVFLTNQTLGTVDTLALDRSNDSLALGGRVSVGQSPGGLVFNNTHEVAYVPVPGNSLIAMYSLERANTTLVPFTPPSVSGGELPTHIALDPALNFAYVIDSIGAVRVLSIDPLTGQLASTGAMAPIATNAGPLAVDPTGQFLYVLEPSNSRVASFSLDRASGALTFIEFTQTLPAPTGLVPLPQGRALYVTSSVSSTLSTYAIDAVDGRLSPTGPDAPVGMNPTGLDIILEGHLLYVGSAAESTITILRTNHLTGTPAPLGMGFSPVAIPSGFTSLRSEPGENYLLVSVNGPPAELLLMKGQSTSSVLQVDSIPIDAGTHKLEANASER